MNRPRDLPACAPGRGDLLRFLALHGADALAQGAELFGYQPPEVSEAQIDLCLREERDETEEEESGVPERQPSVGDASKGTDTGSRPASPMRYYRVLERTPLGEDELRLTPPSRLLDALPLDEADLPCPAWSPPEPPPLAPWRRLWPFLRAALGTLRYSHQVDVERLVNRLASGRLVTAIPMRAKLGWAPRAQLIVDLSLSLYPFWEDIHRLVGQLHKLRGKAGLEVILFEAGPSHRYLPWEEGRRDHYRTYRLPEAGTPVLVLSDLGLLDRRSGPWLAFGQRLQRAGVRPVGLLPLAERHWSQALCRYFTPFVWDHDQRYPAHRHALRRRRSPASGDPFAGCDHLLTLLADAVRIEPGLVRTVRARLLTTAQADVGSEAMLWRHPQLLHKGSCLAPHPAHQEQWRDRAAREADPRKAEADALVRLWHAGLSVAIRAEEQMLRAHTHDSEADPEAVAFMWRVAATLYRRPPGYTHLPQLRAWVVRMAERQHQRHWRWEQGEAQAAALALARRQVTPSSDRLVFPQGFDTNRVLWALDPAQEPRRYQLRQRGQELLITTAGEAMEGADGFKMPGSHIADLQMYTHQLEWQQESPEGRLGPVHLVDIHHRRALPIPERGRLLIRGNRERLVVDGMTRPVWGQILQGPVGLTVQTLEQPQRVMHWLEPGEFPVYDRKGRLIGQHTLLQGCLMEESEYRQLRQQGFRQPDWADGFGVDGYGLFSEFSIEGITQRLRWIPPGRFLMGSPDGEPKRNSDETQHEVTLTEGFWLADTACTQALWEAVMGQNPSRIKGIERPVERVNWDEVQTFIERLNQRKPGLDLCLPSEAQWEYACRAGATTPFHFGANITPKQVNYRGTHPYHDGAKGEFRETTVEVKALPANAWGLYQMHGNVFEWCRDWYGEHPAEPVRDPEGPEAGDARVLRGGAWISNGQSCRSAFRSYGTPDGRTRVIGFRLARGRTGPGGRGAGGA